VWKKKALMGLVPALFGTSYHLRVFEFAGLAWLSGNFCTELQRVNSVLTTMARRSTFLVAFHR